MSEAGDFTAPKGTYLDVDLDALARNYTALCMAAPEAETAGVVKANGYGLDASAVGRKLHALGCRTFFVATLNEGVQLRLALGREAGTIWVLNGFEPTKAGLFRENQLGAVLNTAQQVQAFLSAPTGPCALHVDTGMNRLGVSLQQVAELAERFANSVTADLRLVMSHLACSEDASAAMNKRQLARFVDVGKVFEGVALSLANTGGVYLGSDYHFDLTRPGIGLFGASADLDAETGLCPVATLNAEVLQVRDIRPGESVGYGASFVARSQRRIAIAAAGYADGLPAERTLNTVLATFFKSLPALRAYSASIVANWLVIFLG